MSIFYVMPPRPFLGDCFADFLQTLFPGMSWDTSSRRNLVELLSCAAGEREGVYVIYREDLPRDELPSRALMDGFGAELGDEVIEVRPGGHPGEIFTRRWRVKE